MSSVPVPSICLKFTNLLCPALLMSTISLQSLGFYLSKSLLPNLPSQGQPPQITLRLTRQITVIRHGQETILRWLKLLLVRQNEP